MKRKLILFFASLLIITACTKEEPFVSEENNAATRQLQPFAAWLRTHSSTIRSSDHSEISELLDNEKKLFETKFGYIKDYFNVTPVPRWENPKIVQYDEQNLDIFILCENLYAKTGINNDMALIVSKRKDSYRTYIKLLSKDEKITDRLIVVNTGNQIYLELEHVESGGAVIGRRLGIVVQKRSTRSDFDCQWTERTTMGGIISTGDGKYEVVLRYSFHLDCSYSGSGVTTPPPAAGAGGIPPYMPLPPYTPPPAPPTGVGGSNSGNTGGGGSGNAGNTNNGGNYGGSYGGGYGGGWTYGGDAGGNSGGGGGSSNPPLPGGGVDFSPAPGFEGQQNQDPYAQIKLQFEIEMPEILDEVKKYIQMPDNLEVVLAENCLVNARVVDGRLEVCYSFFANENLTDKDRVAVIYHEVYHIKNDKPTEMAKKRIDPIRLDPPAEFKEFIMKYLIVPSDYDSFSKSIKKEVINNDYNTIMLPPNNWTRS